MTDHATLHYVAAASDLPEGGRVIVGIEGVEIGVFRIAGELHAFENRCAHQGGPVCQGSIMRRVEEVIEPDGQSSGYRWSNEHRHLVCPWHGYEYDVRTGAHPGSDRVRLQRFDVQEREGGIYVSL